MIYAAWIDTYEARADEDDDPKHSFKLAGTLMDIQAAIARVVLATELQSDTVDITIEQLEGDA